HREVGIPWRNEDRSVSYIDGPLLVSGGVPAHASALEFLSQYGRVKIWRRSGNDIVAYNASLTPLVTHTPAGQWPPMIAPDVEGHDA
ncbi:MAG TPA: hypothetical protein VM487_17325, partial [Phycisphaerae bacterium]|nr:hypothetical protein [Phycisphaerae bacterium]